MEENHGQNSARNGFDGHLFLNVGRGTFLLFFTSLISFIVRRWNKFFTVTSRSERFHLHFSDKSVDCSECDSSLVLSEKSVLSRRQITARVSSSGLLSSCHWPLLERDAALDVCNCSLLIRSYLIGNGPLSSQSPSVVFSNCWPIYQMIQPLVTFFCFVFLGHRLLSSFPSNFGPEESHDDGSANDVQLRPMVTWLSKKNKNEREADDPVPTG